MEHPGVGNPNSFSSIPHPNFSNTLFLSSDSSSISASNKDEFRKPQWFEEAETDDELFDDDRKFAFQVFTSPLEMQKHFESQLQRLLESLNDSDGMWYYLRDYNPLKITVTSLKHVLK